jgi:hypothetical protein
MCFVFRNESGSIVAKNADGTDIVIPVYKASFALSGGQTTATVLNDKWYYSGNLVRSQTFNVKERSGEGLPTDYLLSITNLKNITNAFRIRGLCGRFSTRDLCGRFSNSYAC